MNGYVSRQGERVFVRLVHNCMNQLAQIQRFNDLLTENEVVVLEYTTHNHFLGKILQKHKIIELHALIAYVVCIPEAIFSFHW